jgi:hypothetical protein
MFKFLANLTNYKPKDFKGKTVQEILTMKPKNVGDDFFEPANDQAIVDAGLMGEQLDAIELLRDLKDKTKIFERCYKNKTQRRKPASPKKEVEQASEEQASEEQASEELEQASLSSDEQAQAQADQAPAEQAQSGGRKRHRKSKKRAKRKRAKRTKKYNYKGGSDDPSIFLIPEPTRPFPEYNPPDM